MAKPLSPATVFYKVKDALTKERDGLPFNKLAAAAGVSEADLTRSLSFIRSCNLIDIDRSTRRWVLRS